MVNSFHEVQKHVMHIPSINLYIRPLLMLSNVQTIELCYMILPGERSIWPVYLTTTLHLRISKE